MLSEEVKTAYDEFYTNSDTAWRMLGAKFKAQNIVEVCQGIKPKSVLEVGAGDGSILHYLNEWNFGEELYALEIAQSGVDLIKERNLSRLKEAQTFDGYKIPYADDSFDLIILAHVLEHVEHERILIRELKRVAKHVVVEVPKEPFFFLVLHFIVCKRCLGDRIPVDKVVSAVNETSVVELFKHEAHCAVIGLIHGEAKLAKVARATHFFELS